MENKHELNYIFEMLTQQIKMTSERNEALVEENDKLSKDVKILCSIVKDAIPQVDNLIDQTNIHSERLVNHNKYINCLVKENEDLRDVLVITRKRVHELEQTIANLVKDHTTLFARIRKLEQRPTDSFSFHISAGAPSKGCKY